MSKNRVSEIREQMKNTKEPIQLTWENMESIPKPASNENGRYKFYKNLKYLRGDSEHASPPGYLYHREYGFLDARTGEPLGVRYSKHDGFMSSRGFPIRLSEEQINDVISRAYVLKHSGGTRRKKARRGTKGRTMRK